MRKVLAVPVFAVLAIALAAAVAVAATPTFGTRYNKVPNDYFTTVVDTVCSHPSWKDSIVPDGRHNYEVTVCTPSNPIGSGVWVNLVPLDGPDAVGWILLRDEVAIWSWEGQFAAVRLRGAGDADTSIVHYQVWFLQQKDDN